MSTDQVEIVLPSGAFCTVRRVKFFDVAVSVLRASVLGSETPWNEVGVNVTLACVLAARVCKLDDKPMTPRDMLEMDCRDGNALFTKMNEYLSGPVK